MGHRPYAVLAYGYDITDVTAYDKPTPAWNTNDNLTAGGNAMHALMTAAGHPIDDPDDIDPDQVREKCGVTIAQIGLGDDEPTLILAAEVYETDWDTTIVVPTIDLPADQASDHKERLMWALQALGIVRNVEPTWLLGAYYG